MKVQTEIDSFGYRLQRVTALQPEFLGNTKKSSTHPICYGTLQQKFLHLDVLTPYDSEIDETEVRKTLKEQIGTEIISDTTIGWYEYFVESTPQGSSHRIILFMQQTTAKQSDASFPVEAGLLAYHLNWWGQKQIGSSISLVRMENHIYSILFLNGAPHHLLKIDAQLPVKLLVERLHEHALYNNQSKESITAFPYMTVNLNNSDLERALEDKETFGLKQTEIAHSLEDSLHIGLALCFHSPEWLPLDNTPEEIKNTRTQQREKRTLIKTLIFSVSIFLLLAGVTSLPWFSVTSRVKGLDKLIFEHKPLVEKFHSNNQIIDSRLKDIRTFKPLWTPPLPWNDILTELSNALPDKGGINHLVFQKSKSTVQLEAWVQDWDTVTDIKARLEKSPRYGHVKLSDQKKSNRNNRVRFKITAKLAGVPNK